MEKAKNVLKQALKMLKPPPDLILSDWADKYFMLSPESSSEPGRWHTIPYQKGIMDAITDRNVEKITVLKSARVGYTKIINIAIGYFIHQDPCSILVVQPTQDDAAGYSKDEIAPMIRDVPVITELMTDFESYSKDTIQRKNYAGGTLHIIGAHSGRGFRRITVRVVIFDEVDGYSLGAGDEGDQIKLGTKRTETAHDRKIILGSTPTIKDTSRIEQSFEQSDKRYYYVPCPHCKELQVLDFFSGMRWDKDKDPQTGKTIKHYPYTAHFVCIHNGCVIEHKYKRWMVENGQWQATNSQVTNKHHVGFHIWTAYSYSPNASWRHIVEEFLESKDDPEKLKTFVNTTLGQTWEEQGESVSEHVLMERIEDDDWKAKIPNEIVYITMAADVQKDRLELEIKGWGLLEENWSLEYRVIPGDTAQEAVWKELDAIIHKTFTRKDGVKLNIRITCIDAGYLSTTVNSFTKQRQVNGVFSIKGSSTPGKSLIGPKAKLVGKIKAKQWEIGTEAGKQRLYGDLRVEESGNRGYCHFPKGRDKEYFKQLTAEHMILRKNKSGRPVYVWEVKKGRRNEACDVAVYNYAALKIGNPDLQALSTQLINEAKNVPKKKRRKGQISI